jgi:hypothetical protein
MAKRLKQISSFFNIIVQLPFPDISRNIITEIGLALLDRRGLCARTNVKGLEILRLCNLVGKLSCVNKNLFERGLPDDDISFVRTCPVCVHDGDICPGHDR